MEKIIFYCRTSTSAQEKEESIQTQVQKLRGIYKKKNVIKEYLDEGYSGAYMQRPALEQLRADAKKGLFNVLALYSLDRLSRKTGHSLVLQDELTKLGIRIEVLGQDLKSTPEGNLSNVVLSAISEYERDHIRQRMMDGVSRRINAGILIGCNPGYGYRLIKRDKQKLTEARFEIDTLEAESIKKFFKIFLDEQSLGATARKINELKLYKGKSIQPKRVGEFLRDEIYVGRFYYGKTYPCEPKNPTKKDGKIHKSKLPKPKSEWKLIKVPAIIDAATFNRAQEILKGIHKHFYQKTKYDYLCQGLIRCTHCGKYYRGKKCAESKGVPYHAYGCYGKWNTKLGEEKCLSRSIGGVGLEKAVWNYVQELISNPGKIKRSVSLLRTERTEKQGDNQKIHDRLMVEQSNIKSKKSKILDLYSEDTISKEDLNRKLEELNQQESFIDNQIKDVEKDLLNINQTNQAEEEVEKICLEYKDAINSEDFETKKKIVRKWIKEINISDEGRIKLFVRVPKLEGKIYSLTSLAVDYSSLCHPPITLAQLGIIEFEQVLNV
jgi:site-specific DNA recombinase